jgi:hypothetical protein
VRGSLERPVAASPSKRAQSHDLATTSREARAFDALQPHTETFGDLEFEIAHATVRSRMWLQLGSRSVNDYKLVARARRMRAIA